MGQRWRRVSAPLSRMADLRMCKRAYLSMSGPEPNIFYSFALRPTLIHKLFNGRCRRPPSRANAFLVQLGIVFARSAIRGQDNLTACDRHLRQDLARNAGSISSKAGIGPTKKEK